MLLGIVPPVLLLLTVGDPNPLHHSTKSIFISLLKIERILSSLHFRPQQLNVVQPYFHPISLLSISHYIVVGLKTRILQGRRPMKWAFWRHSGAGSGVGQPHPIPPKSYPTLYLGVDIRYQEEILFCVLNFLKKYIFIY